MYISSNSYLGLSDQRINALYILNFLSGMGWSHNSIAGMLGNMTVESTINPGIWENLTEDYSRGFGLVQWTPATKYIDYAIETGGSNYSNYNYFKSMDMQLQRILYEVTNNIQWGNDSLGNTPPFNFHEFTQSTMSPYDLAVLFLNHYERPLHPDSEQRGNLGLFWWNELGLEGGWTPQPKYEYIIRRNTIRYRRGQY